MTGSVQDIENFSIDTSSTDNIKIIALGNEMVPTISEHPIIGVIDELRSSRPMIQYILADGPNNDAYILVEGWSWPVVREEPR